MSNVRSAIVSAACVLALAGCQKKPPSKQAPGNPAGPAARPALVLVPAVGMGDARFGMTQSQVIAQLGTPEAKADGGLTLLYPSKGFSVTVHPQFGVISFVCSAVEAMVPALTAKDFQGKTQEGIGIGATEKDIIAIYGDPDTREDKGRQADLHYPEKGMHFHLLDGVLQQLTLRSREGGKPVAP